MAEGVTGRQRGQTRATSRRYSHHTTPHTWMDGLGGVGVHAFGLYLAISFS